MRQNRRWPLVSVIIPTFNGERFIAKSIESALAQTYANIELIVVDDGWTDATPEVVRRIGDRVKTFLRQRNQGGAAGLLSVRTDVRAV